MGDLHTCTTTALHCSGMFFLGGVSSIAIVLVTATGDAVKELITCPAKADCSTGTLYYTVCAAAHGEIKIHSQNWVTKSK